jgi:hypothetical protein
MFDSCHSSFDMKTQCGWEQLWELLFWYSLACQLKTKLRKYDAMEDLVSNKTKNGRNKLPESRQIKPE